MALQDATGGPRKHLLDGSLALPTTNVFEGTGPVAQRRKARDKIFTPGPKTLERLAKAEERIGKKIDFASITKKVEDIAGNTSLSKKEKKEAIEEIRKEAGISRKEMREIFTGRLEKIYKALATDTNLPEFKEKEAFYKGLYGGKNCVKRTFGAIGSVVKGIAFSPITKLLTKIPVINKFVTPLVKAANKLVDMVAQPWNIAKKVYNFGKNFIKNPLGAIKNVGKRAWGFFKKNWDWIVPMVLNAIPGAGPALSSLARTAIRIYKTGKAVYDKVKTVVSDAKGWIQQPLSKLKEKAVNIANNTAERALEKLS